MCSGFKIRILEGGHVFIMFVVMLPFSLVRFMFFTMLFLMKHSASRNVIALGVKRFVVITDVEAAHVPTKAASKTAAIVD